MNHWWKGLILLLLIVSFFSTWIQLEQVRRWMNQGGRFTDQDGQRLCERVAQLERYSYGFRDAGKAPLNCEFVKP